MAILLNNYIKMWPTKPLSTCSWRGWWDHTADTLHHCVLNHHQNPDCTKCQERAAGQCAFVPVDDSFPRNLLLSGQACLVQYLRASRNTSSSPSLVGAASGEMAALVAVTALLGCMGREKQRQAISPHPMRT